MSKEERTQWWEVAACKGMNVNLFFPETLMAPPSSEAVAVCASCPVKDQCLRDAVSREEYGYWGGTTHAERMQMTVTDDERRQKVQPCGTVAGWSRHRRRGESCTKCRLAYNADVRERMRQKRGSVGTRALRG